MINRVTVIGGLGLLKGVGGTASTCWKAGNSFMPKSERAKFLKPMGNVGQITIMAGNVLDEAVLAKELHRLTR